MLEQIAQEQHERNVASEEEWPEATVAIAANDQKAENDIVRDRTKGTKQVNSYINDFSRYARHYALYLLKSGSEAVFYGFATSHRQQIKRAVREE